MTDAGGRHITALPPNMAMQLTVPITLLVFYIHASAQMPKPCMQIQTNVADHKQ
jgi:hypothetical protein